MASERGREAPKSRGGLRKFADTHVLWGAVIGPRSRPWSRATSCCTVRNARSMRNCSLEVNIYALPLRWSPR